MLRGIWRLQCIQLLGRFAVDFGQLLDPVRLLVGQDRRFGPERPNLLVRLAANRVRLADEVMPRESTVAGTAATCRYQNSEHYGRDRRRLHLLATYGNLADCIDLFNACSEWTREVVEALEDPPGILLGRERWLAASATWASEAKRHGMEPELAEPAVLE